MKILFDSQIFDWQINGGISRAIVEIANRLKTNKEVELFFKVNHSYNSYIQSTPWLIHKPVLQRLHFKGKLGLLKIINEKVNRRYSNELLDKEVPDIFHPTFYDPYYLKDLKKVKLVVTIHDLTNEKFNDQTALTKKFIKWKGQLIKRADHITTVSNNTRKDLIECYKVDPAKVTTVYNGGGLNMSSIGVDTNVKTIGRNYILFVGARRAYKNFKGFLYETASLLKEMDLLLIAAGGAKMDNDENALIKHLGIQNRVMAFPQVSDAKLIQLYSNAEAFIFPSLYEGFGIPALEAMQCGCPLLLSKNSSLPEVGGKAAIYFDPFLKGDLQVQLRKLLSSNDLKKDLVRIGREQMKRFTWDEMAKNYFEVYKRML